MRIIHIDPTRMSFRTWMAVALTNIIFWTIVLQTIVAAKEICS